MRARTWELSETPRKTVGQRSITQGTTELIEVWSWCTVWGLNPVNMTTECECDNITLNPVASSTMYLLFPKSHEGAS